MKKLWHKFWMDWHEGRVWRTLTLTVWNHHWSRYHHHKDKLNAP